MDKKLSQTEQEALLALGQRGAGADFDQFAMSKLFAMGLVEVRNSDRRLILTEAGREAFDALCRKSKSNDGRPQRLK